MMEPAHVFIGLFLAGMGILLLMCFIDYLMGNS